VHLIDDIPVRSVRKDEVQPVADADVLQPPEKPVPMTRYPDVSCLARLCGSFDPAGTHVKRTLIRPGKDRNFEAQLRNGEHSQRPVDFGRLTRFVSPNALLGPESEIYIFASLQRVGIRPIRCQRRFESFYREMG
jgi:hypothetical protein